MDMQPTKALVLVISMGVIGFGLTPDATPNPSETWDKSIKKNIGLDVNVLNNRLSITYLTDIGIILQIC